MDLIRSAIEGLFYNLQPEMLAQLLGKRVVKEMESRHFIGRLVEVLAHRNHNFTLSEIALLGNVMTDQWLVDRELNFLAGDDRASTPLINRLPLLINEFTHHVLSENSQGDPIVRFEHLLRWRELSLLTGEDLLIIPYLARKDVVNHREVKARSLLWPDVLEHDNFRLNAILDKELSDTHSHVNAAQDVFEFNWLGLMNFPELIYRDESFMRGGRRMDYDMAPHYSDINLNMRDWVVVAAALRVYLFRHLPDMMGERNSYAHVKDDINLRSIRQYIDHLHDKEGFVKNLSIDINSLRSGALPARGGYAPDYALRDKNISLFYDNKIPATPYLLHHGERELIYRWFHGYYSGERHTLTTSVAMLLYLTIKTKLRREFIQVNSLRGFENFQIYQGEKLLFSKYLSEKNGFKSDTAAKYLELSLSYAVQSSIGESHRHFLEARVTPGGMIEIIKNKTYSSLHKSLFGDQEFMAESELKGYLNFVVHFIKNRPGTADKLASCRHKSRRLGYHEELGQLSKSLKSLPKDAPDVTGIDAASSELVCRPEVFAPVFRRARWLGLSNITFHAGEDFFDIVDGLRTIDETISFMEYSTGCRIGHGLALGVDSPGYYAERHNWIIVPRQILLDNLVWMKYFSLSNDISLSPTTVLLIEAQFAELTAELGYRNQGAGASMWDYYQSMLMRGDIIGYEDAELKGLPDTVKYSSVSPKNPSEIVKTLHHHYESDLKCREIGEHPLMIQVSSGFGKDVKRIQSKLLDIIEQKGIIIETNPSSNVKIGRFSRYDQHPITLFHDVDGAANKHTMVVSINTDDRGVFATSLKNEYSLIALALRKKMDSEGRNIHTDLSIEEYLQRIAHYSNISRFRGNRR